MRTYRTLEKRVQKSVVLLGGVRGTHLTAGARADRAMVPKPAARTAVACSRPMMNRTPRGMEEIAGVPMSSTKKKNQSVAL